MRASVEYDARRGRRRRGRSFGNRGGGRIVRRSWTIAALVAVAVALGATAAAAQNQPIVPAANQCRVEPRPIDFFRQFVGTPTADEASPVPAAFQMPEGEPADRATRSGVLDTVRQVGACINAGNYLALYALFTDDYFTRAVEAEGPLSEDELTFFSATPEPMPAGSQAALLAILDVRVLPDGRAAVLIDVFTPFQDPPGPVRVLYVMVEQDGRWLIDEEILVGPIDPEQVGTPTA
jgi:hypothetical protein